MKAVRAAADSIDESPMAGLFYQQTRQILVPFPKTSRTARVGGILLRANPSKVAALILYLCLSLFSTLPGFHHHQPSSMLTTQEDGRSSVPGEDFGSGPFGHPSCHVCAWQSHAQIDATQSVEIALSLKWAGISLPVSVVFLSRHRPGTSGPPRGPPTLPFA